MRAAPTAHSVSALVLALGPARAKAHVDAAFGDALAQAEVRPEGTLERSTVGGVGELPAEESTRPGALVAARTPRVDVATAALPLDQAEPPASRDAVAAGAVSTHAPTKPSPSPRGSLRGSPKRQAPPPSVPSSPQPPPSIVRTPEKIDRFAIEAKRAPDDVPSPNDASIPPAHLLTPSPSLLLPLPPSPALPLSPTPTLPLSPSLSRTPTPPLPGSLPSPQTAARAPLLHASAPSAPVAPGATETTLASSRANEREATSSDEAPASPRGATSDSASDGADALAPRAPAAVASPVYARPAKIEAGASHERTEGDDGGDATDGRPSKAPRAPASRVNDLTAATSPRVEPAAPHVSALDVPVSPKVEPGVSVAEAMPSKSVDVTERVKAALEATKAHVEQMDGGKGVATVSVGQGDERVVARVEIAERRVTVHFTAADPAVQIRLQTGLSVLARDLGDKGLALDRQGSKVTAPDAPTVTTRAVVGAESARGGDARFGATGGDPRDRERRTYEPWGDEEARAPTTRRRTFAGRNYIR